MMEIKKINLNDNNEATPVTTDTPTSTPSTSKNKFTTPLFIILALVLGVSTGAVLKNLRAGSGGMAGVDAPAKGSAIKSGEVFGAKDKSGFPDEAIGILEEGGIDGEGTHKLLRPGGESQTAYLTSSILDLDEFVGFKITVWGETFSGQKAGWLMDVGRIKVEELEPTPLEE